MKRETRELEAVVDMSNHALHEIPFTNDDQFVREVM
jgi:hypothetical protein